MMEEGDYAVCQFSAMIFLHMSLVSADVDPNNLISQDAKVVSKLAYKIITICQGHANYPYN